jgi:DDE superfamily endonuclease
VLPAPTRPSLPPSPGHPARIDSADERVGTANAFVLVAPHIGWRQVEITERRTPTEYAQWRRWLVDVAFPAAPRIRVVQDHLSTHDPASLYATFPPAEAHRIRQRLEFHDTPVHGSWLNRAAIEIGIFERGCLSRPLEGLVDLRQRAAACEAERTAQRRTIQWQFTTPDARTKLARLYPNVKSQLD